MILKQILKNTLCVIVLVSNFVAATTAQPCKEVVGYYPSWRWYERGGLVRPANIRYQKYSTIIYSFFAPSLNGSLTSTDDFASQNILKGQIDAFSNPVSFVPNTSLVDLAHRNGVKVVLSIGGEQHSEFFSTIAADITKRTTLATACRNLMVQYGVDGIDVDWEHPGDTLRNGQPVDKENFTLLCQAIRNELTALGLQTGKTYTLSAAVGAGAQHLESIDWQRVTPIVDRFHLMAYDFFGDYDPLTRFNAPLYLPNQTFNNALSVDAALRTLTDTYGVPPSKILGGLAFYGQAVKTQGTPAPYIPYLGADTQTFPIDNGNPSYHQILSKINLFTSNWDVATHTPYLIGKNGLNTYVTFDDESSIAKKAQYFVDKGLRGAFFWEMTGDYLETAPNSGVVWGTPLADTVNSVFCGRVFLAPCPAPIGLNPTPTLQEVRLRCDSVIGANTYAFEYKKRNTATWISANSTINRLNINSLDSCTEYEYRVRALCGENRWSAYSEVMPFKTTGCTTACSAPSGLQIGRNLNALTLTWNPLTSAQYKLQWQLENASDWNTLNLNSNTYVLLNILNCLNYRFRLASVCNGLESAYSAETPFFTGECPTCDAPLPFSQTSTANSATLNWTAQTRATAYQVRYRAVGASNWATKTVTNPTILLSDLNDCTRYEVSIQSTCATGNSPFSTAQSFVTTGCVNPETDTTQCSKPKTYYFGTAYQPLGELKLGQGQLTPINGQSTDAYIPQNRLKWAISMIHAAHLFKSTTKITGLDANFLWATALFSSRCGCDGAIQTIGNQLFPLVFDASTQANGCFQIGNSTAYAQLSQVYPLRFPAGQHPALIANDHFTTAALANTYNDLLTLRLWEVAKGWQVETFFRTAADPHALIRLLSAAHTGGAWMPVFERIFKTDRQNALRSRNLSTYFAADAALTTHQQKVSDAVWVLNNQPNALEVLNPTQNHFDNYYDAQVSWSDVQSYIHSIKYLYPEVKISALKNQVRAKFNSINNGQSISFRYQLGAVLNELILNLPVDEPTAAIAANFGCVSPTPIDTTAICAIPQNLYADSLKIDRAQLHWTATAPQYSIYYKKTSSTYWFTSTKVANIFKAFYLEPCATYVFKVKSLCPANLSSAFSSEYTFQLPCSGIAPMNQNATKSFEIAPNPSESLQISFELDADSAQNSLEISNLQGQILKTMPLGERSKGFYELKMPDSADLQAGLYWITLKTHQARLVKKWLKQ